VKQCLVTPSEAWPSGIKNDAANDAEVVLRADGFGRVEEMRPQIINVDTETKGRGKTVFSPTASRPSGILDVASIQPAISVWKWSGNPGSTGKNANKRAQSVAMRRVEHGTNQVADHVHMAATSEDVRGKSVVEIQYCSKTFAGVGRNAHVRSAESDAR